ncbi:MAG: glycosyl transferase family 1 [Gemmatimonadota bacterium]|nr:MAG: glycosyl transferase family 1 [Gemmatimonadota bacterium]
MRILYLTSGFPYPLLAGHLRYYHFMRELARRHEVRLFSLAAADFEPAHEAALREIVQDVRTFRRHDRQHPVGRWLKEDARLFWGIEPGMRELQRAVAAEAAAATFDVILTGGKRVFPAVRGLPVPAVADICDAESERFRGRLEHSGWKERPRVWLGWQGLRAMEKRVIRGTARSLFASARDRDALLAPSDPRGVVVPNGVDPEFWKRESRERGLRTLVFTGAMHYRPNADAALLLIREIYPELRREYPDTRLLIVGKDPSAELQRAGQVEGVTVTGLVDDVRPYLEQASHFVAPLRYASGIQNKVLEAMAMELPVITTPAAADGVSPLSGPPPPLTMATTVAEFRARVREHFAVDEERRAPVVEARRFVEQHFSWATHAATLESVLLDAINP